MWKRRRSEVNSDSALFGREMLEWVDVPHVTNVPKVVVFVTDDKQWHSINLDQYRGGSVVPGKGFTATLIIRWVSGDVDTYEFRNIDTAHSVLKGLS